MGATSPVGRNLGGRRSLRLRYGLVTALQSVAVTQLAAVCLGCEAVGAFAAARTCFKRSSIRRRSA
jgi:hypothetical protein